MFPTYFLIAGALFAHTLPHYFFFIFLVNIIQILTLIYTDRDKDTEICISVCRGPSFAAKKTQQFHRKLRQRAKAETTCIQH